MAEKLAATKQLLCNTTKQQIIAVFSVVKVVKVVVVVVVVVVVGMMEMIVCWLL